MFGLGYVTGEDRLFLADALRNAGRANLSSFVGGANVEQDRDTFRNAPYRNDGELLRRSSIGPTSSPAPRAPRSRRTCANYTDGMNQWIAETRVDPSKQDALYTATAIHTRPGRGPEPWDITDVIATGALVAGIFGKGGGDELGAAVALQDATQDPRSPQGQAGLEGLPLGRRPRGRPHRQKKVFPYRRPPKGKPKGMAMPDPGSVDQVEIVAGVEQPGARPSAIPAARSCRGSARSPPARTPCSSPAASPRAATRSRCSDRRPATSPRSC